MQKTQPLTTIEITALRLTQQTISFSNVSFLQQNDPNYVILNVLLLALCTDLFY